jgi:hypothetical protein
VIHNRHLPRTGSRVSRYRNFTFTVISPKPSSLNEAFSPLPQQFFLPNKCHDIVLLKSKLAIIGSKGFEVTDIEE